MKLQLNVYFLCQLCLRFAIGLTIRPILWNIYTPYKLHVDGTMENGYSHKQILQYEPCTLYSIKARMTDFLLEPRTLNKLKELSIVRRRRGTRAGIQKRIRKTKPANFSYPYGIFSNINSIQGKFTHLEQTIANKPNLCFIALQETKIQNYGSWSDDFAQHLVTDEALQLEDFYMFRLDREFTANGGGLITYISKEWSICSPKLCLTLSTPDIELLSVSARPRFLPSSISNIVIVNMYTRPSANFPVADTELKKAITKILKSNPRSNIVIVGDINRNRIPFLETMGYKNLVHFITYPRSQTTLDAVYVKGDNYQATKLHPIATSDHFSIGIIPKYTEKHRQVTKKKRRRERNISMDNINYLREMMDSTDWSVFTKNCYTLHELTEVVSCYINFTTDICIPHKLIPASEMMKRLPADEKIKFLEKEKLKAIETGDTTMRNRLQREINKYVHKNRSIYFEKVTSNSNSLWSLLKSISKPGDHHNNIISSELGIELNEHFGRFNSAVTKDVVLTLPERASDIPAVFKENEVQKYFSLVKRGISSGFDNISWWVFKYCSKELSSIFSTIFQS